MNQEREVRVPTTDSEEKDNSNRRVEEAVAVLAQKLLSTLVQYERPGRDA